MGKQTMGTPAQNIFHRTDNKMYRLQTGQTPIVRPDAHNTVGLDGYPNGMNAVVCVISYTGYDMEDASIIAKSSHERGYGYGTVYKGEWIDLTPLRTTGEPIAHHFGFRTSTDAEGVIRLPPARMETLLQTIDLDGLPQVGARLTQGDPFYAICNDVTQTVKVVNYKGMEDAYVDQVRLVGKLVAKLTR
jgi:DNA-directed RNA polymerase I subunit RPA2